MAFSFLRKIVADVVDICYNTAWNKVYLNGRRFVLFYFEGTFALFERGAVLMITYSELFLLLTLIVSIVALVIDITKKK